MKRIMLSIMSLVLMSMSAVQANFFTNFCKEQVTTLKTTGFRPEVAGLACAAGVGASFLYSLQQINKAINQQAKTTGISGHQEGSDNIRKNNKERKYALGKSLVGFGVAGILAYGAWKFSEK